MDQNLRITQNNLRSEELITKLLGYSTISSLDTVYDLGAGKGIITKCLSSHAKKVISVELDQYLCSSLRDKFAFFSNVEVVNGDILDLALPTAPYKIFSNIPFNITSSVITKYAFGDYPPEEMLLVLQKEAATKLLGVGEGYLTNALLRPFFDISIVYSFNKSDFEPSPSVDTVFVRIKKASTPLVAYTEIDNFRDFICYILLQQKPTLRLRVTKLFTPMQFHKICKDLNIEETVPAKQLNSDAWVKLFQKYTILVDSTKKHETQGSFANYKKTLLQKKENVSHRTKLRI